MCNGEGTSWRNPSIWGCKDYSADYDYTNGSMVVISCSSIHFVYIE